MNNALWQLCNEIKQQNIHDSYQVFTIFTDFQKFSTNFVVAKNANVLIIPGELQAFLLRNFCNL